MPIENAVGSLKTIQFVSGDRFFAHRYCGALRQELPLKSEQQLRKTIDDLRELERKCFAARNRFAFFDYLAAVFELYVQLRRRNQAKPSARHIANLFGLRKPNRTHPIRTIIDANLDGRYQDPKPLEQSVAIRLARTQNMERLRVVPA
jgi:hypothetical protein